MNERRGPGRPRRQEGVVDAVGEVCVSLRRQGHSLGSIAGALQAKFGRSYTKQAVQQRLKQAGVGVTTGVSPLPSSGFVWLRQARAWLRLSTGQIGHRIFTGELKAIWGPGGPGHQRLLRVSDLRRLWPAHWERAKARAREMAATERRRRRRRSPILPSKRQALPPLQAVVIRKSFPQSRPEETLLTVTNYAAYRKDRYYGKVVETVDSLLREKGSVAPVEVFVRLGLLSPLGVEEWRRGRVAYLERLLLCDLGEDARA